MADAGTVRTEALLLSSPPVAGANLGGRYRLLERIGRGGMADVFAAEDELLIRRVAVKIFRFDLCTEDELRRVRAEMQTLAALHHPGLVTVYDAGTVHEAGTAEELSSPYLVMELVRGPNLGQRLAEGALGQADTAQLGTELAATLAYVHARGVIHRDVKPANILLDPTIADDAPFASKLTDFGIARVVDSTHHTEAGFTLGTANYLSPEQALSAEVGPPTDVYSLGLVLLECLTGELAYPGSGIEAALARLNRQPEIPAAFGPGWRQLLAAATERDPANRPTAAELGAELRTLAASDTLPVSGPPPAALPLGTALPVSAGTPAAGSLDDWYPDDADDADRHGPAGLAALLAVPPAAAVGGLLRPERSAPPAGPPATEDETATEAIRLTPPAEPPHRHRPRGGMIAAALLLLAALLTSGLLLRAGHAGGNDPGAPVNFSATTAAHSSAHSSVARPSTSAVAGVSSVSRAGGPAAITTSVVTRTVTRSAAPPPASSAVASSASQPPPSSASASASSSSSPSSSAATASASATPTKTKHAGRG